MSGIKHFQTFTNVFSGCVCVCVCTQFLYHAGLFVIPWTVAHQAPLSMEFSRQKC